MKSKEELKKNGIKNRACYCFDNIIKNIDINFSGILLDEKLYEIISVYEISYKTSMSSKPLRIRFDKIDGFIWVHGNEFRYLALFDHRSFNRICDIIK